MKRASLLLPLAVLASLWTLLRCGIGCFTLSSHGLRGSDRSSRSLVGLSGAVLRNPSVARGAGAIDWSNPVVAPTIAAMFGGIATGVGISMALQAASSGGNLNESLKARLSADAGMEDVEDEAAEKSKTGALIKSMKEAQGISDDEVKKLKKQKVEENDGW
eukprot:TRINITY_DN50_c0_g1_i1.p2 TRINITY_DN50_c0_g1~~TRINITY_DN50_c0_g1_i1.p2  ORF type:complete len:161 (+),score=38.81 TRINITY_DN50_c0_g1_i1:56-538(+)